ncbi:MAG: hypothetical protein JW774_12660 [Candidatus Aureabacteria bacterium]|nr:hypothetical protein [Candidatus Auribacterota bacterium]
MKKKYCKILLALAAVMVLQIGCSKKPEKKAGSKPPVMEQDKTPVPVRD